MTKSHKEHNPFGESCMYGTTIMGARGQLVIPAAARKDLDLQPGDRVLVVGRFQKMLGLMKASMLDEVMDMMMDKINSKEMSAEMKKKAIAKLKEFKESHSNLKDK